MMIACMSEYKNTTSWLINFIIEKIHLKGEEKQGRPLSIAKKRIPVQNRKEMISFHRKKQKILQNLINYSRWHRRMLMHSNIQHPAQHYNMRSHKKNIERKIPPLDEIKTHFFLFIAISASRNIIYARLICWGGCVSRDMKTCQ